MFCLAIKRKKPGAHLALRWESQSPKGTYYVIPFMTVRETEDRSVLPGVRAGVGPEGRCSAIKGRTRGPSGGELFSLLAVVVDT